MDSFKYIDFTGLHLISVKEVANDTRIIVYMIDPIHALYLVQGSGGYADIIANVYMQAHVENTKTRDETGHVCTRQVSYRTFLSLVSMKTCIYVYLSLKKEEKKKKKTQICNNHVLVCTAICYLYISSVEQPQPW